MSVKTHLLTNRRNLRDMRTRMGWSQSEAAKAAKISPSHYSRIEAGDRHASEPVARRITDSLAGTKNKRDTVWKLLFEVVPGEGTKARAA